MVELMVAIGVLLIAIVGAVSGQLTSAGLIHTSRETTVAMTDLEACMERILTQIPANIPGPGSEYEQGQPVEAFEGLHLQDERIVPAYPGYVPGGPVPDPLTIVLTITWNDYQGRPRRLALRSMKVR